MKTAPLLAFLALHASAVAALDVRVQPARPRQGDTIAVWVNAPGAVVTVNGRDYAAFDAGGGQYRALIPTSPLDAAGRWTMTVRAAGQAATRAVVVAKRAFAIQHLRLPPGTPTELGPVERARVAEAKGLATADQRWKDAFRAPTRGRISTPYGVRRYRNGVFLKDYYHRGIDYAPGAGVPVLAPADARVALVGRVADGFNVNGNTVGLDHGQGVVTMFLHLQEITVKEGQVVHAGETVGAVGATGEASGPHLHWGLYVHGVAVDPEPWLRGDVP